MAHGEASDVQRHVRTYILARSDEARVLANIVFPIETLECDPVLYGQFSFLRNRQIHDQSGGQFRRCLLSLPRRLVEEFGIA